MPTPLAPPSILSHNARTERQAFVRASSTPQSLSLRARIVLRAADTDSPTKLHIGRALGCGNHPVGPGRRRSLALGVAGLHDALRPGRPRTLVASTRVQVISVASTLPHDQERAVTRWTRDESGATVLDARHPATIRRSSLWRLLHDMDLKPPQRASWLQSHDEDCDAKAHMICPLYAQAIEAYQQGRLVMCCDEKTGLPVLERTAPPPPAPPGRRARREHASSRHGTRGLSNALAVATGRSAWPLGSTRTATDVVAHLQPAAHRLPPRERDDWVMDNLHPHWSLDVCRLLARWCKGPFAPEQRKQGGQRRAFLGDARHRHVVHGTPKHGSWLHPAALFFRVVHRRFLARGSFPSAKDLDRRWERLLQDYNLCHAPPYRWTYTEEPFVRDTPFSRTRRQQRQGRACCSPRLQPFERLLYSPRPSRRHAA